MANDEPRQRVRPGDIYWLQLGSADGLEPRIPHPHVVVQEDAPNYGRCATVVMCGLTSNLKRVDRPGNVLLEAGEANLPRPSVVEVSKVVTVDKAQLGGYIGSLSEERMHQIIAGMRFVQTWFLPADS